jgi:hypothetical protein
MGLTKTNREHTMNTFKKNLAVTIATLALGGFASTQAFAGCEHSGYSSYQPPRHVEYSDDDSDYAPPRHVEYGYGHQHRWSRYNQYGE